MSHPRSFCVAFVAACCLVPAWSSAAAAEPQRANPALARARELFDQAETLLQQGRHEEARVLLEATWTLHKHWQVAALLAAAEMKTARARDAAEHTAIALRLLDASAPEKARHNLEAQFAEAKGGVATVQPRGLEPGSRLFVDDRLLGDSSLPDPIFLEPGVHILEMRRRDQSRVERQLLAQAGTSHEIDFYVPLPCPAGQPGADAARASTSPLNHRNTTMWLGVGGGVLSLAALSIGIGFSLRSSALDQDARRLASQLGEVGGPTACQAGSPECATLASQYADRDSADRIAAAGYIGFAFIGAATLATVLLLPRKERALTAEPSRLWLAPRVGENGGLVAGGTF